MRDSLIEGMVRIHFNYKQKVTPEERILLRSKEDKKDSAPDFGDTWLQRFNDAMMSLFNLKQRECSYEEFAEFMMLHKATSVIHYLRVSCAENKAKGTVTLSRKKQGGKSTIFTLTKSNWNTKECQFRLTQDDKGTAHDIEPFKTQPTEWLAGFAEGLWERATQKT